ncbi:MAG: cation-translocating P-type ATPase [Planctomycetaceae bacterium]
MTTPADPSTPRFHSLAIDQVAVMLATDARGGLVPEEAAARLRHHGRNAVAEPVPEPAWRRFLGQFRDLVVWILAAAAVVSAILGEWIDTVAIAGIVLVNAVIGFLQEQRAHRALAALAKLTAPQARVRRAGAVTTIPAAEVVPGDRLELEAGDAVVADARVVEQHGLELQESALTGESEPVVKEGTAAVAADASLGDRRTMVHAGTIVAAGRGAAVVTATGSATELGRIAALLDHAPAEQTPLQRRLAGLGRVLIVVCMAIVTVIFLLELARGADPWEVMLRSVSLAVAAVPEGLPAVVTLVLAVGVTRMVRRNALVRRLPSVETLGSVTVICSDKTGTLTRNEMTVREVATGSGQWRVTGVGYTPRGRFVPADAPTDDTGDRADTEPTGAAVDDPDLRRLLSIGARCGNAVARPTASGGWQVVGDPTEGALVVAALKAGIEAGDTDEPVVYEVPFDPVRRSMAVVVRPPNGAPRLYTKGAAEVILAASRFEQRGGTVVPLDDDRRRAILGTVDTYAAQALRVLGMAWRDLDPGFVPTDADGGGDLVFVGLVGMIDPPRDEAREAVRRCRAAGIRPVMITGDHPATALAIARELGIAGPDGRALSGRDLDALGDERLRDEAPGIDVYARVSPEHKLRVVRAWQARGEIVAMTGDGVNDAPAVKAADIGIAMGIGGTDVTREASDMVLTDDNFASIESAVEEGRGIYDNIRKVVHYLLSCNAAEVLVMFAAALAGWPSPLAAIQILWINLVTDGFPALALGLESPERDAMLRPPRPPHEPVITLRHGIVIVSHGLLMAAVTLAAFLIVWRHDAARLPLARTVTFCTVSFAQLLFAIGCRSDRATAPALGFFANPALLAALAVSAALQVAVVVLPAVGRVFEIDAPPGREWLLVVGLSLIPVTVVEVAKLIGRRRCGGRAVRHTGRDPGAAP